MSTLEHALIMLLLLTGLLSARPRFSLAAQIAIVGAVALAVVAPIVPIELPWNVLATIHIDTLMLEEGMVNDRSRPG